jgi:hypothetical protein
MEQDMTKDEALKLALEAMEYADACLKKQLTMKYKHEYAQDLLLEAGTAIKEALAQPEQEPVGEIVDAIEGAFKCSFTKMLPVGTKLYTTPPQRKPLTDEEIQHLLMPVRISGDGYYLRIARAIEAAHSIKGEA